MDIVKDKRIVVVLRGGGDLATGVAQKLWHAGFSLVILEKENPLAIRRTVALSSAMQEGSYRVEDMLGRRISSPKECEQTWAAQEIPLLADPDCRFLAALQPAIVVDGILAKRNIGMHTGLAPLTIALGPGFRAPRDVDVVIETMRGHQLGRLILDGEALANTGVPGEVGGKSGERVVHAPVAGRVRHRRRIGDRVKHGEILFYLDEAPVHSPLDGTLRGLIAQDLVVPAGMKCADVDPRPEEEVDCLSISDKARSLGGAVLEACFWLGEKKGIFG